MLTKEIAKEVKLYNETVKIYYNDKGHKYLLNGKSLLGVTSVLSVINKPALVQWAANCVVDYLKVKIEAGAGLDELKLDTLFKEAKQHYKTISEDAKVFGTLVHNWIEAYIKGKNPAPLVNDNARKAVDTFLAWAKEKNVKFTSSEKIIYSKKFDYAGTCDFTCEIDGKRYVGDIKTSKGIYEEYLLQVAAYRYALQEEEGKDYDGMLIVRIPKSEDDTVEIANVNNYKQNATAFMNALSLYRHLQLLKATKKGDVK